MHRPLQIFIDISKAAEGHESRRCPFRKGRPEKTGDKRRQRFQRRAKNVHKNVSANFVADIILSLRRAALHGEHAPCKNCGKLNHFEVCCQESKKKVLSVDYLSEAEEYEYVAEIEVKEQVNALASSPHPNKVFATLMVNGNQEKFQLDSGSTANIMTDETVLKLCGQDGWSELEEAPVTLVMYNQSEVKPLGKKRLKVINSKNNKKYSIEFHLVHGECKSILDLLDFSTCGRNKEKWQS